MKIKNLILLAVALCAAAICSTRAASLVVVWDYVHTEETGFIIERAPAGSTATFAEVARVPATVLSYTDANLPGKTVFQYRVRAFNADVTSPPSNIASATTSPNPLLAPGNVKVSAPVLTVNVPAGTTLVIAATK